MNIDQDRSPWRFLSPLHAGDASDCELVALTRSDELRIVTDMVSASRVSLLYAFSGNGKSSLINAGVVPHFQRQGYAVFKTRPRPPWSNYNPARAFKDCLMHGMELPLFSQGEVVELREARDLAESLPADSAHEIAGVLDRLEAKISRFRLRSPAPEDFLVRLQSKLDCPIVQFLSEIRDYLGDETRILIVYDQFEELFVHYNNSPELDEFVSQLGEVWADNSLKVHFLFSMREDWVGSMIAFRKVIPDIFVNYYKLSPLGRKYAANVLTFPIARLHMSWETEAVETVLNDLVRSYSESQTNRFNGVDLTPSPAKDPYVELPALQIVADRFWRTRDQHHPPFTLEHYRSLASPSASVEGNGAPAQEGGETPSPAQEVLDSYLLDQLGQIHDDDGLVETLQELRLDLLYLLTDRVRHRRALTETGLLAELRRLRPRELDLPAVDHELLERALRPLVQMRLVTEHETPDRQKQYELAHDFAVRSVVRDWRRLDQERTAQLAFLRRDQEKKEKQLEDLVIREQRQLKFLRLAPLFGLAGLIVLLLFSLWTSTRQLVVPGALIIGALLVAIVVLAASTRRRWSLAASLIGIVGTAFLLLPQIPFSAPHDPRWGQADLANFPALLQGKISGSGDEDYFFFLVPQETDLHAVTRASGGLILDLYLYSTDSDGGMEMVGWTRTAGEPLVESVYPGEYWLSVRPPYGSSDTGTYQVLLGPAPLVEREWATGGLPPPDLTRISEREPNNQGGSRRPSLLGITEAAAILLCVLSILLFLVIYLRSLIDLNERLGASERIQKWSRVVVAELVDILVNAVLIIGILAGLIFSISEVFANPSTAVFVVVVVLFLSLWLMGSCGALLRWKRTAGAAFCGLSIETEEGRPLPFWRALARQVLFLVWMAVNIFYLAPFVVISLLVVWASDNKQNFYDTWVRAVLRKTPPRHKVSDVDTPATDTRRRRRRIEAVEA